MTFVGWIYADTLGESSVGRVFHKGTSPAGYNLRVVADGTGAYRFAVDYSPTDLIRTTTANSVLLDQWHHIAVSWDGGIEAADVHIYVNGSELSYSTTQDASGSRQADTGDSFFLGNRGAADATWKGFLAECAMYNVVLTVDEIKASMRLVWPRVSARVGYWPLYGRQSPEPDMSGNGNHGALTGTTTVDHPPGLSIWSPGARMVLQVPPSGTQTSQTQTGVARITAQTTKTQTGVSRITAQTTKTQTGLSRVTVQTTQTQAGVSRVTAQTTKTQTGVSRVTAQTTKTQAGVSRITATTTKTQDGVANILVTGQASRTQTGVARITATTTKTQTGTSRVKQTVTKTQTGVSNIASGSATTTKNQTGKARITARTSRAIGGTAAIHSTTTRTIQGVASIGIPAPFTSTQTIQGVAKIFSQRAIKRRVTISIPISGSN
jgi:hypothetical protein